MKSDGSGFDSLREQWPWVGSLTAVHLSFLVCSVEMILGPICGLAVRIEQGNVLNMLPTVPGMWLVLRKCCCCG